MHVIWNQTGHGWTFIKEKDDVKVKALGPDCAIKTMLFMMKRSDNFVIPLSFPLKGQINK